MEREPTNKDSPKPLSEGFEDLHKLKPKVKPSKEPKVKPSKKPKDDKKPSDNERSVSDSD